MGPRQNYGHGSTTAEDRGCVVADLYLCFSPRGLACDVRSGRGINRARNLNAQIIRADGDNVGVSQPSYKRCVFSE